MLLLYSRVVERTFQQQEYQNPILPSEKEIEKGCQMYSSLSFIGIRVSFRKEGFMRLFPIAFHVNSVFIFDSTGFEPATLVVSVHSRRPLH